MIFNFVLVNHGPTRLKAMRDLLAPIFGALEEADHHVIHYAFGVLPAPAVNVLVDFFPNDGLVDSVLALRAERRDGLIFGVLCTDDIDDPAVMAEADGSRRRDNLLRLLPAADFVWTTLAQADALAAHCVPGRVAQLHYGFCAPELNARTVADPRLRGTDVVVYGAETPYRSTIAGQLKRRRLQCAFTDPRTMPPYLASDIVGHAKLLLDLRDRAEDRFLSPAGAMRGLHNGTLVLSESWNGAPPASPHQNFIMREGYAVLADRCEQVVRSGQWGRIAETAAAGFRSQPSMRDNLTAAMAATGFARFQR